jgi:hypothetical protein
VAALLEHQERKKVRVEQSAQQTNDGSAWRRPRGGWSGRGWSIRE